MSSKTKKVQPESSDDEVDQIEVPEVPEVKKRTKKERTPAQVEAFKKALTILKEKRELKSKEDKERFEKADAVEKEVIAKEKYEKSKNHKKKLPPAPSYVTTGDLERFKNDLITSLTPKQQEEKVKEVKEVVHEPVKERVVIQKPVVEKVVQKSLTGHDLLDKLFFS